MTRLKNILSIAIPVLCCFIALTLVTPDKVLAQEEPLYLVFEFMRVDNEQETAYQETETFWKKIHQQRVKSGEIIGWDLWSLRPGGENQGYQYLTVTLYNDPVKMMSGSPIMEHARKAYPKLSDVQLTKKFEQTAASRDLAIRLYLEEIAGTSGNEEMKVGTVASIDMMKAKEGMAQDYENAENEIFKPWHQSQVDADQKGSWGLLRIMNPIGTDTYASHITVNMYRNWTQMLGGDSDGSDESDSSSLPGEEEIQKGLETRDMKWVYLAVLQEMVR